MITPIERAYQARRGDYWQGETFRLISDQGASWYSIGAPLTAVASSTVQLTVVDINAGLMRARVSTAGVGVTAGYVMIKAHD